MKKLIEFHKRQVEWWMEKLSISWYGVAWISFAKGVIITMIIAYLI